MPLIIRGHGKLLWRRRMNVDCMTGLPSWLVNEWSIFSCSFRLINKLPATSICDRRNGTSAIYSADMCVASFKAQTPILRFVVSEWVSEQGLTSPPTQYRSSGRQFYRSKAQPTASEYTEVVNLLWICRQVTVVQQIIHNILTLSN